RRTSASVIDALDQRNQRLLFDRPDEARRIRLPVLHCENGWTNVEPQFLARLAAEASELAPIRPSQNQEVDVAGRFTALPGVATCPRPEDERALDAGKLRQPLAETWERAEGLEEQPREL